MGAAEGDLLVIGWGGTRGNVQSAVEQLQEEGKRISLCHFNYIHPLPHGVREILGGFRRIVVCELNEGQLASYLPPTVPGIPLRAIQQVRGPALHRRGTERGIQPDFEREIDNKLLATYNYTPAAEASLFKGRFGGFVDIQAKRGLEIGSMLPTDKRIIRK